MKQQSLITLLSLSSSQRWLLSLFGVILIITFWWWYDFRPSQQRYDTLHHDYEQFNNEYQTLLENQQQHHKKVIEQQNFYEKFRTLSDIYSRPLSEYITLILNHAAHLGCRIETIKCQPRGIKEWYASYVIILQFHTKNYTALKQLLQYCQQLSLVTQKCEITCNKGLMTCLYEGKVMVIHEEQLR